MTTQYLESLARTAKLYDDAHGTQRYPVWLWIGPSGKPDANRLMPCSVLRKR